MNRRQKQIEYILMSLLVFSLPFNWFFKWNVDSAYLRGLQIDYFLPKLYLQDIFILCLGIYFLYSYRSQIKKALFKTYKYLVQIILSKRSARVESNTLFQLSKKLASDTRLIALTLLGYLLVITVKKPKTTSFMSLWHICSLACLVFFILHRYSNKEIISLIWKPLSLMAVFQSLLSLYQFIFQKSAIGYILFGETNLVSPGGIARESFFGQLLTLPYGTFPHPNVLSAFLGVTLIVFFLHRSIISNSPTYRIREYIFLGLIIPVLLLTRSWVVITGLFMLFLTYIRRSIIRLHLLVSLYIIINIVYVLLPTWYVYQSIYLSNNASIIRRIQLNSAAQIEFWKHFWLGSGLGNSTKLIHTSPSLAAPADFIQPIHSIYLIWITETGIIGTLLLAWLLVTLVASSRSSGINGQKANHGSRKQTILWIFPLMLVLWAGSFDHYLITLRQGQLLSALAITIALSSRKIKSEKVS